MAQPLLKKKKSLVCKTEIYEIILLNGKKVLANFTVLDEVESLSPLLRFAETL